MVMSDVSLTVPYEASLIAETSSAAVETSAVPLAAILSSANTLVDTGQRTIQRVSMILSIRFFYFPLPLFSCISAQSRAVMVMVPMNSIRSVLYSDCSNINFNVISLADASYILLKLKE